MTERDKEYTDKINKIIMKAVTEIQDMAAKEKLGFMSMDTINQITASFGMYLCVGMGHDDERKTIAKKLGVESHKRRKT